jgi:hypothetical protein
VKSLKRLYLLALTIVDVVASWIEMVRFVVS